MRDTGERSVRVTAQVPGSAMRWDALAAVIACLTVFSVAMGLTYPLLALQLEARGLDTTVTGLNAAMTPLGLVLSAPFVPFLARWMKAWRFAMACVLVTAAMLAAFKLWSDLLAWHAFRLLLGVALGGLFAVTEAWINELADGPRRGRIIAVYTSVLSLGFATGPFLLGLVGSSGWTPFLIGIVFALCGLMPLMWARRAIPAPVPEDRASFVSFLPLAPTLLLAVGVFAVFDTASMSLFPLYGLRQGVDEATATKALTVLIAGNVLLQYPIGWLADRLPRRAIMIACATLAVGGASLLPLVLHSLWLWPLLFFWGAAAFGVYTLALAELGDRFSGALLLAGTAAFVAVWGLGGILGPPSAGLAMEHLGPDGLPLILAVGYGLLIVLATGRWLQSRVRRR